jgi:hypothetical protein
MIWEKDFVVLENLLNQNVKFGQKIAKYWFAKYSLICNHIFSSFFYNFIYKRTKKRKKYS